MGGDVYNTAKWYEMRESIKDKYSTDKIQNLELNDDWTDETEGELEGPKVIRAWMKDEGHKIFILPGESNRYMVKEVNDDKVFEALKLTDSDERAVELARHISEGTLNEEMFEEAEA